MRSKTLSDNYKTTPLYVWLTESDKNWQLEATRAMLWVINLFFFFCSILSFNIYEGVFVFVMKLSRVYRLITLRKHSYQYKLYKENINSVTLDIVKDSTFLVPQNLFSETLIFFSLLL